MIHFLTHDAIDRTRWDEAIDRAQNGLIYARSWYLDIVCPRWCALVNEDYSTVFPLTSGNKYGFSYLFPPFFTQQLGVFSSSLVTSQVLEEFIKAIPSRFRYIEVQLNSGNPAPDGFVIQPRTNLELDIYRPLDEIRHGYTENHTRSIRRSQREGVKINISNNAEDVIRLFRQGRGREVKTLKDKHYLIFKKLVKAASERNACDIRTATNSAGQLVAGAVFFRDKDRSIMIFSGASEQAKQVSAAHLIIDNYISEWASRLKILDFEGSDNTSLARFYTGFGSEEVPYLKVTRNSLPVPFRWFK